MYEKYLEYNMLCTFPTALLASYRRTITFTSMRMSASHDPDLTLTKPEPEPIPYTYVHCVLRDALSEVLKIWCIRRYPSVSVGIRRFSRGGEGHSSGRVLLEGGDMTDQVRHKEQARVGRRSTCFQGG